MARPGGCYDGGWGRTSYQKDKWEAKERLRLGAKYYYSPSSRETERCNFCGGTLKVTTEGCCRICHSIIFSKTPKPKRRHPFPHNHKPPYAPTDGGDDDE